MNTTKLRPLLGLYTKQDLQDAYDRGCRDAAAYLRQNIGPLSKGDVKYIKPKLQAVK